MVKCLVFAIAVAVIISCGQNEPLADYVPKSVQEEGLKQTFLDFQDGVNTQDAKKVEGLIHADAALMVGRERKILSRAEYVKVLPERLADNPPLALSKPKISVEGQKAEVRIYMTRGDYKGLIVYNMKLEDKKWYIVDWKY